MSKKDTTDEPKSNITRLKLGEETERLRVERGIEVELDDGTVLTLSPPELWPEAARDVFLDPEKGDEDLGRAILGDDKWQVFVANGGTPTLFAHLLNRRYQLTQGESSASSSS